MGVFIHNIADFLVLFLLFSVTIFVHELFHFITALKLGLVVETFSIGFGPAIWQVKHKGITYKMGWIPFGGYVALPQLDPSGMATIQGSEEKQEKKKRGWFGGKKDAKPVEETVVEERPTYPEISPWKKVPVAVAGVIGNILLAIVLAWIVYKAPAAETGSTESVIGYVDQDVPAYAAGLRMGDRIIEVNGEAVDSWHDFTVLCVLDSGAGSGIPIKIQRQDDEVIDLVIPATKGEMDETHIEGIGPASPCLVGEVIEGGSAEKAGIQSGDVVLSFDGVPVAGMIHFIDLVSERGGDTVSISLLRDGEQLELEVTPQLDTERGRALIGVQLTPAEMGVLPWMRHKNPWAQIKSDATEILRILKALVTPRESKQAAAALGGPVMILTYLWLSIKVSIFNAVGFLRFLNVNLAILNMLPIPVLDGGHIVFAIWEGLTRKRVPPKFVNALTNVFATLLICAFVLITFRDFVRLPRLFDGIKSFLGDDTEQVQTNETATGSTAEE